MGIYACLSHCWGGVQPLQTNTDTKEAFLRAVPWNVIPRTYKDAISVAADLDVPYLWIDSLCIVQDDHRDWLRESAVMCNVYENSYLTFAASSAANAHDGLHLRPRRAIRGVEGSTSSGRPFRISDFHQNSHPSASENRMSFPLMNRAWVYQERLLSPRVLHFGEEELLWECREHHECECEEMETMGKATYARGPRHLPAEALPHLWHTMVSQYSRLSLTKKSDKLPAISGLGKEMAESRPGERYLAGLWSGTLELDLLWTNKHSLISQSRGSNLDAAREASIVAPSWSWASIDTQAYFPLPGRLDLENNRPFTVSRRFSEIRSAWVRPVDAANSFGGVTSGALSIHGPTIPAELSREEFQGVATGTLRLLSHPRNLSVYSSGNDRFHLDYRESSQDASTPKTNGNSCPAEVQLLRLWRLKMVDGTNPADEKQIEYALVIQRIDKTKPFERIGLVLCRRSTNDATFPDFETIPSFFEHAECECETVTLV